MATKYRFFVLVAASLSASTSTTAANGGGGTITIDSWLRGLHPALATLYAEGLRERGFASLQQIAAAPETTMLALFDQLEMKKPHRR